LEDDRIEDGSSGDEGVGAGERGAGNEEDEIMGD